MLLANHVTLRKSPAYSLSLNMKNTYLSLVAQRVKNLPALWESSVQSLDQEDPLEKGVATHSNVLARRIPGSEEPGGLQSMHGVTKS